MYYIYIYYVCAIFWLAVCAPGGPRRHITARGGGATSFRCAPRPRLAPVPLARGRVDLEGVPAIPCSYLSSAFARGAPAHNERECVARERVARGRSVDICVLREARRSVCWPEEVT